MTAPLYERPMRRANRSLSPQACLDRLRQGEWGVLCLTAPDGQPYGVPLNYALLEPGPAAPDRIKDGVPKTKEREEPAESPAPVGYSLIFHSARAGLKVDMLTAAPQACFTVVVLAEAVPSALSTRYESVLAFGPVRRLDPGEDGHDDILRQLGLRFSAAYSEELNRTLEKSGPKTTVWILDIQGLTGKFNPAR